MRCIRADRPFPPQGLAELGWWRLPGLLRRKDLAIEIVEAEIRAAQHEILLEPGA